MIHNVTYIVDNNTSSYWQIYEPGDNVCLGQVTVVKEPYWDDLDTGERHLEISYSVHVEADSVTDALIEGDKLIMEYIEKNS